MELKAKDLRIGNYVNVYNEEFHPKLKGVTLEVDTIDSYRESISLSHININDNKYYESYSQFLKYLKPIPLTKNGWLSLGQKNMMLLVNFNR